MALTCPVSTLRRNARRKEEFLGEKSKAAPEQEEVLAGKELTSQSSTFQWLSQGYTFSCEQFDDFL